MTGELVAAGGGREVCGLCGNRCRGVLCDRCQRQLAAEQKGRIHAPR